MPINHRPRDSRASARLCASSTLCLLLTACGGGTSDGSGAATGAPRVDDFAPPSDLAGPGEDAADASRFGLSERVPLADFDLPLERAAGGGYRLVQAYPELRFAEALLARPVPGEERMLVVEQAGKIRVFDDDPAVREDRVVLDISSRVVFTSEQGLLGFAFDPEFERNRFVYLDYTIENPNLTIVSRMVWDPLTDTLDQRSEKTILRVPQPYSGHNGGMLEFGSDGYLYIALGDGGDGGDPQNNAQDRSTLLGSLLRIDVSPADPSAPYDVPADNPFVGLDGVRPEIYAYGLRNPFRFSFDRQTGDLWLGDVGQEDREEIDLIEAGGNYGWRVYEGTLARDEPLDTLPASAFTPPLHEYGHDQGIAVIGGYVYRGTELPALFGRYLYGDFGSGTVWALTRDGERVTANEAIATVEGPTSFGETRDGEVLVISRYGGPMRFEAALPGAVPPATLSATGLFADLASLSPVDGLLEYAPAHPFWSDGTRKRRWLGIPDGKRIGFGEDDWTFPVGTVSVKHFEIELIEGAPSSARRLETRVLLHTRSGWQGYSYHWDADQSDATLANDRRIEELVVRLSSGATRRQRYDYPSRADCLACHTRAAGFLLGPRTAQLNTAFAYPGGAANQLATYAHIGLFDRAIGDVGRYRAFAPLEDEGTSVAARARAYLDVNCSTCHRPGGNAPTRLDLRADVAVGAMNVVGVAPSKGDLGIRGARLVAPGDKGSSVLWQRLRRTDGKRMPPLSTHVVDEAGVALIGRWIDALR